MRKFPRVVDNSRGNDQCPDPDDQGAQVSRGGARLLLGIAPAGWAVQHVARMLHGGNTGPSTVANVLAITPATSNVACDVALHVASDVARNVAFGGSLLYSHLLGVLRSMLRRGGVVDGIWFSKSWA